MNSNRLSVRRGKMLNNRLRDIFYRKKTEKELLNDLY